MGVHKNIDIDKFPEQGSHLGKLVVVCFNYDTKRTIEGIVVRDDKEDPFTKLIQLRDKDRRIVNATECQYKLF